MELADVETLSPGRGEVRVTVSACGICGTDAHFVAGGFPGTSWPLTPGHEIAGKIAELGEGIEEFAVGDRVAVGWFGGCCYHCDPCRKGIFIHCENGKVPSWQYPGGYAESVTVPVSALARIPAGISDAEAAPLGCAGVTTVLSGVRAWIEELPLSEAAEGFAALQQGRTHYRTVLTM